MKNLICAAVFIVAFASSQSKDSLKEEISLRQTLISEIIGTSRIAGAVIDFISKKPIGNVRVEVLGTSNIVLTGPDGQFQIMVPSGYYQVQATANGYRTEVKNNVRVKNDDETELFFALRMDDENPPDFVPVDKQPQPLFGKNPAPKYPELGRKIRMEGIIWIKLLVNEEGNATKADVIREEFTRSDSIGMLNTFTKSEEKRISEETYKAKSQFLEAAKSAALQWKFTPAMMGGQNVKVWVSIPFKFKLDPEKKPLEGKPSKKK